VSPEHFPLEDYYYNEPVLNPNNAFEFAFIRDEGNSNQTGWNAELCVYNFCSNEMDVLTDLVGYDIDWSVKDWIIFTGDDYQLYKIKSNGDSLIKLTDTGNFNYKAKWNDDGTKYLYFDADAIRHKICDEEGGLIKDFSNNMAEFDWLNDDKIIFSRSSGTELYIKEYDLNTETEVLLYSQAHQGSGEPLSVHENKIYFTSETGVHLYENGSVSLLDSSFLTYSAGYPQYLAPNKVLLQRFITDTTYFPCTVYGATYISILDLNDNSEKYVDIPQ
jgi:Tol biopolymer transport system component